MFYLENKRWPKEGELENYNKTDVKTYVGDGFIIYEENGKYEIRIEKRLWWSSYKTSTLSYN